MTLLVLNGGSSTLKYALYEEGLQAGRRGKLEHDGTAADFRRCLSGLLAELGSPRIRAVGHRVVHGGADYSAPILLDANHIEALRRLTPLAPLHQPHNLAGIDAVTQLLPGVPQVACFDTAFHHDQPALAQWLGLTRELHESGMRRYGFHGISFEYIAAQLPAHLGAKADGRVIVAHLGSGASLCALHRRRSIATTMGFSTLDGLLMATRCGNLDPGAVLHLMQERGMDAATIADLLYQRSGLLGVSGISGDMRTLLASETPEAREAVDLFCYRVLREIGSLAAALGGVDALVFTGGIGEHAQPIRERIGAGLGWLGPDLTVLALATDEESLIAQQTARLCP
ncbi:MAG: acetate/propionate family kinase [Rhodocyclaceae bacterium]|nr:acetate/propionate family kinase [Rhodocyclaceae bacterium]